MRRRQVAQAIFRFRMGPLDSFLALAPSFKDLALAASSTSSFLLSAERQSLCVGLSRLGRTGDEVLVLMGVNMMSRWVIGWAFASVQDDRLWSWQEGAAGCEIQTQRTMLH